MGRFFNFETGVLAALLLAAGLLTGTFVLHLGTGGALGVGAAVCVLGVLPLGIWLQDKLIPFYVSRGMTGRALDLAIQIRDAAPGGVQRTMASIDVALVHLARGDFENALGNLRKATLSQLKPLSRGVVLGNTAYCLAHLGKDLDTADANAQEARKALPDEGVFDYFAGLVKLKQGQNAEAVELIRSSLTKDPDPAMPLPGERNYMLAQALKATGDEAGSKQELAKAKTAKGRFGDLARAEAT